MLFICKLNRKEFEWIFFFSNRRASTLYFGGLICFHSQRIHLITHNECRATNFFFHRKLIVLLRMGNVKKKREHSQPSQMDEAATHTRNWSTIDWLTVQTLIIIFISLFFLFQDRMGFGICIETHKKRNNQFSRDYMLFKRVLKIFSLPHSISAQFSMTCALVETKAHAKLEQKKNCLKYLLVPLIVPFKWLA